MFSPNDKYIVTGTSTMSDNDSGKLAIFDRDSLEKLHELTISDSVIIKLYKFNTIIILKIFGYSRA